MKIVIEVINGTIQEAEEKANELREKDGALYTIMKYSDMVEIVESKARYINEVRKTVSEEDVSNAYKKGWEDCKEQMLEKFSDYVFPFNDSKYRKGK